MKRNISCRITAIFFACILTGCGAVPEFTPGTQTANISAQGKEGMLDEASIEYEAPISVPSIIVDLVGYETGTEKKAIIDSRELPETFAVREVGSGEVVFEGSIKKTDQLDSNGNEVGIADFTDLDSEGDFYIEADIIGTSKAFTIRTGVYDELAVGALSKLTELRCGSSTNGNCHNKKVPLESDAGTTLDVSGGWHTGTGGERDVVTGCNAVYDLVIAYEYHPSSFSDDMGIPESGNKIPDVLDEAMYELNWLFKMQNPDTGGVYSAVAYRNKELVVDGEATRSTVNFCVVMTHFSAVIRKFDSAYSTKCLNAATKAWKCLNANKEIVSSEQMYRAAVELYKVTGQAIYKDPIDAYLKDNSGKDLENRAVVDAAITHMSTSRSTNMAECEKLMERFMSRTHAKVASARSNPFMVESEDLTVEELLRNTEELVIVDYIISSVEYQKIEENYLHFLCGRNPGSEIMLDFEYNPDGYAMLLVLLGRLKDRR